MVVVHTSGSTSEPKGVVHTHGALIRHLDNLNQLRRYTSDEVLFSNSPFFWIGGFAYALLGTLVAGATLVCSNSPDAAGVLDVLERERPTMVNGFAATVAHLPDDPSFAGRDLSSIRRGNLFPIMPADVRPADPELRHTMLGMTEAGSVCLASDDESDQPEHRRGSFGRPVPGFEAEVRGDDGVLWFRGPFLMEGYLGRERHETFDADGWYCTGDLVTVDDDGFVYFRGRASDMIKTAGANVSPREVEAAILEVSGLVAHVVGVPDETKGQLVAALVRAPADGTVDVDDLRARLRERLSAYKVPKRFVVVAARRGADDVERQARPPGDRGGARWLSPRSQPSWPSAGSPRPTCAPSSRPTTPITYAELDDRSAALAARFVAAGVVKGDRLALLAPNGIDWAVTAFAAMRIGAVLVPLSTLLRPPELLAQLQVASVSHLVTAPTFRDRDYLADLEQAAPGLVAAVQAGGRHAAAPALRAVWLIDEIPATAATAELVAAMEQRVTPADDLAIMFTSGSRGLPKGVIHTHGGAIRATAAGLDARCVGRGERLYIPMPFFWMGGFGGGLLTAVVAGATLLTEAEPEPDRHARAARARAGHPLPRLARPGRPPRRPPRLRRRRPVVARRRQPRRRPARRPPAEARAPGPTSSG